MQDSRPTAVVDIGSNSIRLVVYQNQGRSPLPLFNEKVLCGLGRGLAATGRLNVEGAETALSNLRRFQALAEAMGAETLDAVATAAVRDAVNGADFIREVERATLFRPRILSGLEEARLSALGVLSGIPDADGLVGDLGGGSLELVDVAGGTVGSQTTLPLGPLNLIDRAGGDLRRGRIAVDRALGSVGWVPALAGRSFYAVGGAWRTLARLLMERRGYPLHIIHEYAIDAAEALGDFAKLRRLDKEALKRIPGLSRRRLDSLPWAVLVLERLLDIGKPRTLVFSAFGLREGILFDRLSPALKRRDPLLAGTDALLGPSRFPLEPDELFDFAAAILPPGDEAVARLAKAASRLSDIAWMEHPDYRGEHAYRRVLRLPLSAIEHSGRAFLAVACAARYGSGRAELPDATAAQLLTPERFKLADEFGMAMRLGYTLSGGAPGLLAKARLTQQDQTLVLALPADGSMMVGDTVHRRLETLARSRGLTARLIPAADLAAQ